MSKLERGDNEIRLEEKVVGFLGFGFMAQSLARGFMSQKVLKPSQISYFDSNSALLKKVSSDASFAACIPAQSNEGVLERSDIVIIAVKPQVALSLLESVKNKVDKNRHLFVSICAGITIKQIQTRLPNGSKVIRTMPNTAVSVGMGATVVSGGKGVMEEECELVCKLFGSVGLCLKLPENNFNAVTAISGSGPAYAYMGLDAAGDGGAMLGLTKKVAQQLAAYTMMGAAKMFLESQNHAGILKDAVCSPGGTTLAGVRCLEKGGFRSLVMETIVAAHDRSKELEVVANAAVEG